MYKTKKLLVLLTATVLAFTMVFAGCGKNAGQQAGTTTTGQNEATQAATEQVTEKKLDPVELVYYPVWVGSETDIPIVNEEMNKILKEKINATIKIIPISAGDYETKMNVINNSGEYYDLAFTAFWLNNYYNNVSKGNLLVLDDLLPKYAPDLWELVPPSFWDAARVKGKIFGAINYQIGVDTVGVEWDMELIKLVEEKTGLKFDIEKYKNLEDFEPILEAIKKADIPSTNIYSQTGTPLGGIFTSNPVYHGYDTIGDYALPGWVKLDDASMKVVNQYDTDAYKNFIKLMRKWYQAGYIRKDAAVATDLDGKFKYRGPWLVFTKPGADEMTTEARGREYKFTLIREPVVTTNRASATMTGISSQSKNPERALMYLNLMATDELLFNTFVLGIENKHYVKTGPKTVDYASGYDAGTSPHNSPLGWAFGNQFLEWFKPGIPTNIWEDTDKLNKSAKASPILGFSFDPEPIKTETAACQAVLAEFIAGLDTGTVDPDVYLQKMLDKLKTAGVDKIIAEKQRQIDEWKATKK